MYRLWNALEKGKDWDDGPNASILRDRGLAMYPEGAGCPPAERDWTITDATTGQTVATLHAIDDATALVVGLDGSRMLCENIAYAEGFKATTFTVRGEACRIEHADAGC